MSKDKKWITNEGDVMKVRTCAWSPPGDHPVGCSMFLHVKDGKVVKVEGDPNHPITQGRLCPRCIALDEVIYNKDRIMHPMKRAKEDRGKDAWVQITWDEAYDIIETEVRRIWKDFGKECTFTLTGTGRESTLYAPVYAASVLSSPNQANTLSGCSCYGPRCTIANFLLGAGYPELDYAAFFPDRFDDSRYEIPKYIFLWGKNPIYSNPDGLFGHVIVDLMKRGSKLIVLDPRVTWLSVRSEYHLQLRPGTDAAVGLALINVIISEDLYDHDFVDSWCYGFESLKERAAQYTPEQVEKISWVPKEKIIGAARAFATNKPSSALWGLAIDTMKNGVQAGQCFLDMAAICGYMDIPGGITLAQPSSFMGEWRYEAINSLPPELQSKRIEDPGKYKAFNAAGAFAGVLGDTLLNWLEMDEPAYPLKLCWIIGSNFLAAMGAEPRRWMDAMQKLDLVIINDIFMNPTAMACCDLFLPLTTFAEHDGVVIPHFGRNTHLLGAMNKAIDGGDTKSDVEIMFDMGKRLCPDKWPWATPSEFFSEQLHTKYDWGFDELQEEVIHQQDFEYRKYEKGLLRPDGEPGFDTPTGLIELKSTLFAQFGDDALPYFEEPDMSPYSLPEDVAAEYPLVLTTGGREIAMFHSEHRQVPSLRAIHPWPNLTIHPDTASKYHIEEGDWVAIENPVGRVVQKAKLSKTVDPRVVHADHGWWYPEQNGEAPNFYGVYNANVSALVPNNKIGILGFGAPYKNIVCKVYKVNGPND